MPCPFVKFWAEASERELVPPVMVPVVEEPVIEPQYIAPATQVRMSYQGTGPAVCKSRATERIVPLSFSPDAPNAAPFLSCRSPLFPAGLAPPPREIQPLIASHTVVSSGFWSVAS